LRFPFACLADKRRKVAITPVGVEKVGDGNAFLGWDDCGSRVFSFYLS
jgi:hypothetical protein